MLSRLAFASLLAIMLSAPAPAALVSSVFDGRIPCVETQGVQYCEGSIGDRAETWDGVPLDANVTLPPAGMDGPFPLIVDLHGWSLGKTQGPQAARALAGFVVLSYTARGFHDSCGTTAARATDPTLSDPDVCTKRGWIRLGDARYEIRDTQYLAGVLADAGLVIPNKVGVTGISYGGGQSMLLAALRNRIMLPDGTLAPWTSPMGTPMEIAAAAPLIPWSDLAEALTPTGRTLDYRDENPYPLRAGIQKKSWNDLLYNAGLATGFYAPAGVDPDADLPGWNARLSQGEPYDGDPLLLHILGEITAHHSAYYIDDSIAPAPLFIYNSFVDDLFPGDEALRFRQKTLAKHPDADITLNLAAGFGHPRANLAASNIVAIFDSVEKFFARKLKGSADPAPAPITVSTQGCAGVTSELGPFTGDDWGGLRPGEVRFTASDPQTFDQRGNPDVATQLDPVSMPTCRTLPAVDDVTSANYRLPAAAGNGYTLMGAPTVIADLDVGGNFAQVVARLWDVAPDGNQTMITHLLYRPRTDGESTQVFQLHPNGWHFAAGHVAKLELLGQSDPYGRASNGTFTVTVSNLELRLPVLETPDGGTVLSPAQNVLPSDGEEQLDVGPPACPAAPVEDCRTGSKASVHIKDGPKPERDLLVWKWKQRGTGDPADFGDPLGISAYRLCVWDAAGALVTSAAVPPGGTCPGKKPHPCWTRKRTGAAFATRDAEPVAQLTLSAGKKTSELFLRAQGGALALPAPPIRTPLTAQLLNSGGVCWEASK